MCERKVVQLLILLQEPPRITGNVKQQLRLVKVFQVTHSLGDSFYQTSACRLMESSKGSPEKIARSFQLIGIELQSHHVPNIFYTLLSIDLNLKL